MLKRIKLGDYLEAVIHVITLGFGQRLSEWIAIDVLGYQSCGCCQRKQWLNRLTNPQYNGDCDTIKLF
jgi:hypothetical protein